MATAKIEFTVHRRGAAQRKAREIKNATPARVLAAQALIEERGGYQLVTSWESEPAPAAAPLAEGSRVEAGEGAAIERGRIDGIDGNMALVAWDSGIRTVAMLAKLRAEAG